MLPLTYLIYIFITLCFYSTYISVSLHLVAFASLLWRATTSRIGFVAGDGKRRRRVLCILRHHFRWHGALGKTKKIVLRGIGAVEVSVFFRPAFIFITMKPSHHILIYCLSTFLSWVIGTLQLAATPRIEFESPHTLVLYQKVHKKEKEVLVH